MGVEIAGCATELGCHPTCLELVELTLQTIREHTDLLAQTGGRSRLAVGAGQHGNVFPLLGVGVQLVDQFLKHGDVHLLQRLAKHQGKRGVVDVLGGQSEMDELLVGVQSAYGIEFFLDEILDGLHVMVGDTLDVLHTGSVLLREILIDFSQRGKDIAVQ